MTNPHYKQVTTDEGISQLPQGDLEIAVSSDPPFTVPNFPLHSLSEEQLAKRIALNVVKMRVTQVLSLVQSQLDLGMTGVEIQCASSLPLSAMQNPSEPLTLCVGGRPVFEFLAAEPVEHKPNAGKLRDAQTLIDELLKDKTYAIIAALATEDESRALTGSSRR